MPTIPLPSRLSTVILSMLEIPRIISFSAAAFGFDQRARIVRSKGVLYLEAEFLLPSPAGSSAGR